MVYGYLIKFSIIFQVCVYHAHFYEMCRICGAMVCILASSVVNHRGKPFSGQTKE